MALDNTVEELIQRVRDIADEDNTTDVTDAVILRMLNRSQQELVRILTKHYKNHFMREVIYSSSSLTADANSQTRVLAIPDQAFGFAVNSVDVKQGQAWFPLKQVPWAYTLGLDTSVDSGLPLSYAIQGGSIYLYGTPSSDISIRVRYQFRAPKLVKSEGRITAYDADNETVTLDALGANLTTSVDSLGAFVNVIDHLTGNIKATLQVSAINTSSKVLSMKTSSLDRSEVFGYTVATALPSTITYDDYICPADGTCAPYLSHDLTNFLVDMAGFYVKRKLGTVEQADMIEREALFKSIASMQFGRQYTKKIMRKRGTDPVTPITFFRGN